MTQRTPSEILRAATHLIGRPRRGEFNGWTTMSVADCIAQVSASNAANACEAFRLLHDETGAVSLRHWENGKPSWELIGALERAAERAAA